MTTSLLRYCPHASTRWESAEQQSWVQHPSFINKKVSSSVSGISIDRTSTSAGKSSVARSPLAAHQSVRQLFTDAYTSLGNNTISRSGMKTSCSEKADACPLVMAASSKYPQWQNYDWKRVLCNSINVPVYFWGTPQCENSKGRIWAGLLNYVILSSKVQVSIYTGWQRNEDSPWWWPKCRYPKIWLEWPSWWATEKHTTIINRFSLPEIIGTRPESSEYALYMPLR